MPNVKKFLIDGFKCIQTLKSGSCGTTEIVLGDDNQVYIRKIILYGNLPYDKLKVLPCDYWPKVYYVANGNNNTTIIEEFIHGQNLQEALDSEGYYTEQEVRRMGTQLCDALAILHANGIIHRDIKPSNIILTARGDIKLIDFGSSRELKNSSMDTTILGTPGYAPPEQFGFSSTDVRSDIYSLGITLRELAGNKTSSSFNKLIKSCTELDPKRRLASAQELKKQLANEHCYKKYLIAIALVVGFCLVGAYFFASNKTDSIEVPPANGTNEIKNNDKADDLKKDSNSKASTDKPQKSNEVANKNAGDAKVVDKTTTSSKVEPSKPKKTKGYTTVTADLTSSGWIVTGVTNELYIRQKEKAKALGAKQVNFYNYEKPFFEIHNLSKDEPLWNPRLTLNFKDMVVYASDFSINSWGGRRINILYEKPVELGFTQARIRMNGTVLPNDFQAMALYGKVYAYYVTGPTPSVAVRLEADNAPAVSKIFKINIE